MKNLPSGVEITAAIVADVSPFGKKESFTRKAYKTFKIFGLAFFLRYSIKFIVNKFFKPNSVKRVLDKNNVKLINLNESINSQESLKKINNFNPDLLISIAGNEIFKRNANHLEDLLFLAPNINYSTGASRGKFYQVRGIGERSEFTEPVNAP